MLLAGELSQIARAGDEATESLVLWSAVGVRRALIRTPDRGMMVLGVIKLLVPVALEPPTGRWEIPT